MTEQEIEVFEKQLKAVPLRPLSDAFFAGVAAQLEETSSGDADALPETDFEDLADIEAALRRLHPVAPSKSFFEKVAAELADDSGNEIVFPKKRNFGEVLRFPRWLSSAATVAVAACAVAVGLKFSGLGGSGAGTPNYELVSAEKQLCGIEELPVEERDDGTLVCPVRYIYASTKRWRDPHTQSSFVEYRPFEETVPVAVAVY